MKPDKDRKSNRGIELTVVDGKKPKSSTGLVDPKLFSGEPNLFIKRDPRTMFWYFKYDSGFLPEALRDTAFTSFDKAKAHAEKYFKSRNLTITKVYD